MREQVDRNDLWKSYWQERQKSLQNPQGKRGAVLAAFQILQKHAEGARQPARVIELGCGEGHILGELLKMCAAHDLAVGECVGVDYQPGAIETARDLYPHVNFIVADYASRPLNLQPFDLVMMIGTLHEVYSSSYSPSLGEIDRASGRKAVEEALRHGVRLVKDAGHVVVFDGVEHEAPPESEIIIKFSSAEAWDEFRQLTSEYEAFRLVYKELAPGDHVRMSVHDFTRYITKTRFFNSDLWEIEKRESYQYFRESEFKECLGRLGLRVLKVQCHSPYEGEWRQRVSIETPGVDFPKENILIVGRKITRTVETLTSGNDETSVEEAAAVASTAQGAEVMRTPTSLKGLPKEIWFLHVATLISRSGTMALIFLVVYLSAMGVGEGRAGLAVSVYGLGGLIAAPLAGCFCDRFGPPTIMKAALFLQGGFLLLFPFAGGYESFLCTSFAWAIAGEAFRPASSAFIGGLPDEGQRKVSFAMNRTAVNIGMAIGPAVGGIVIQTRPSYIFIANSTASVAAGLFLTFALRGEKLKDMTVIGGNHIGEHNDDSARLEVRGMLPFLISLVPAFVVFYQYRSTMPQYFLDRGILEPHFFGLLLPINTLLVIACQAPLAVYLQRWPDKVGMSLGAFLVGTGFGGFALATTFLGIAACVIVWTFGEMALLTSSDSYVSKVAGSKKGQYMGLYHMTLNFAAFIGPGLGAAILRHSAVMLWGATFVWGCLSSVLLLQLTKRPRPDALL